MNPFDLLGDDAEDPSQLAAALPKKVEKAAPVQSAKAAKMPTKPLPPSEAGIKFFPLLYSIEQICRD